MTDPAISVAAMISEHPSGDLRQGLGAALSYDWPDMTWPVFQRGLSIALEIARADGRDDENMPIAGPPAAAGAST